MNTDTEWWRDTEWLVLRNHETNEALAYVATRPGLHMEVADRVDRLLASSLWWVKDDEVETYGIALEAVPVVLGRDIGAILFQNDGSIETWGL